MAKAPSAQESTASNPPTPPAPTPATQNPPKSISAIVALVLAIIALVLSAVPIINNFAFLLVIVAIVFAIVAIVGTRSGKKSGLGMSIVSLVLAIIAAVVVVGSQAIYSAAIDEATAGLGRATGDATEEILGTEVEVKQGTYKLSKGNYGMINSELPITVTNLTDETSSYMIEIEAINAAGDRITQDTIYVNDLGAGQSQNFKAFQYISSDDYNEMKNATFQIMSVGAF